MPKTDVSSLKRSLDISKYPASPFNTIALALSGGGFRSAGYSLGVLSYLQHLQLNDEKTDNLLQHVKYLSTTSGGTITGAFYAYCNHSNIPFTEYYERLFKFLDGEMLLDKVLAILKTDEDWKNTDKRRNLINSFAKAYDSDLLFNGTEFQVFWNNKESAHIEEVCFNTTEFFTGITFRFQTNGNKELLNNKPIGNSVVSIESSNEAIASIKRVKLADILAASSCFPAGFEPIIYPNDFSHSNLTIRDLKEAVNIDGQSDDDAERKFIQKKTFGLMDGGITDNQGLNSLMEADVNRPPEHNFDVVIVNDVASHYMMHYAVPTVKKDTRLNRITPKTLQHIGTGLIGIYLLGILSYVFYCSIHSSIVLWLLLVPHLLLLLAGYFIYRFIRKKLTISIQSKQEENREEDMEEGSYDRTENFTQTTVNKLYAYLRNVDIATISQMFMSRMNSILTLNGDVFLKHIRRIIYDKFYQSHLWDYRRVTNHIYELSYTNIKNKTKRMLERDSPDDKLLTTENFRLFAPNDEISRVAQNAFKTPTTLWFDDKRRENFVKESLIACGQFTLCHNLMKYIFRIENETEEYAKLDAKEKDKIQYIKKQLMDDWIEFKNDPFWMLNKISAGIQGFQAVTASQVVNP